MSRCTKEMPILAYSKPNNTGDFYVLNPNFSMTCGLDENNNVFVEVHAEKTTRYYVADNDVTAISRICRDMYYGCNCELNYTLLEQVFTEKLNRQESCYAEIY